MQSNAFLLYGANGYTGRLIIQMAAAYDLQPVLAGRNEAAIKPLAAQYNLPYKIADLNNAQQLYDVLRDVPLVLHAAGPFKYTAWPMIEACLKTRTHYLDITGEIEVFEVAKQYDSVAQNAGIMIMPGVGFDVVPTDCLALYLKNNLPDATSLKLAFASTKGGLSHGTATTMAEGLGEGGAVRQRGHIIKKPLGHKGMWVDFGEKRLFVMTIPWGDVSTAYQTTGIPNIETYTGVKPSVYRLLKLQSLINPLLRTTTVRNFVKGRINRMPAGPTDSQRAQSKSLVWGEVQNKAGQIARARLTGPDGYTLTAHSSLIIACKVLNGRFMQGYQTPAGMYGADLILEVPGTQRTHIS